MEMSLIFIGYLLDSECSKVMGEGPKPEAAPK